MIPLDCLHAVSLHCAQKPRQRTCILSEVIIDPSAWAGWLYAQRFGTCLSRAAIWLVDNSTALGQFNLEFDYLVHLVYV